MVAEKDFKKLMTAARDNERMKNSMKRFLGADLAAENERLEKQIDLIYGESKNKDKENKALRSENRDLRDEIGLLYETVKGFLKERTEDLKAFRNVLKSLVDKVKGKDPESEF